MLTLVLRRGMPVALAIAAWLVAMAAPASAQVDADTVCAEPDGSGKCLMLLDVTLTGDPAVISAAVSGGGAGAQVYCSRGERPVHLLEIRQNTVYCQHERYGWYSQSYDCYFTGTNIPPEFDGVILPSGYEPGDPGSVYYAMCFTDSHPDIDFSNFCPQNTPPDWCGDPHLVFLTSEPDGFEGTPDPVPGLLVSAINEMAMQAPTIGTAPPSGQGSGLVRLPVWLWNEVDGNNWGTLSATAGPIAGISVVAQAEATGIAWDMDDGAVVHCDEGVAWQPGMNVYHPPCGHAYSRSSRDLPDGVYEISATTTWAVEWRTEGLPEQRGGEFVLEPTSTTTLQIDEVQVLFR
jgi:hypothetical protein